MHLYISGPGFRVVWSEGISGFEVNQANFSIRSRTLELGLSCNTVPGTPIHFMVHDFCSLLTLPFGCLPHFPQENWMAYCPKKPAMCGFIQVTAQGEGANCRFLSNMSVLTPCHFTTGNNQILIDITNGTLR